MKKICPKDMTEERVRIAVDNLLKRFDAPPCCMQCHDQQEQLGDQERIISCETYRQALQYIEQSSGPMCRWSKSYERAIIKEIKCRMELGTCRNAQLCEPKLDVVETPKKKKVRVIRKKEPPPKKEKPKPKPKSKPKPKPKPQLHRIVWDTPKDFKIETKPDLPGIIQYRLSNQSFICKGWTKLPRANEHFLNTYYTFQTEPCGPILQWKKENYMQYYPNKLKMSIVKEDGTIQVFYPNCGNDLAIHVIPYGTIHFRVIVYFNKDEYHKDQWDRIKGRPAAIFDSYGNGVVYDTKGKVRLKYDQAEGKLLDIPNSCSEQPHPPLHWKWQNYPEVIKKRELLYHQKYGCSNLKLPPPPDMTRFLPKQKIIVKEETEEVSEAADKTPIPEKSGKSAFKIRAGKSAMNLHSQPEKSRKSVIKVPSTIGKSEKSVMEVPSTPRSPEKSVNNVAQAPETPGKSVTDVPQAPETPDKSVTNVPQTTETTGKSATNVPQTSETSGKSATNVPQTPETPGKSTSKVSETFSSEKSTANPSHHSPSSNSKSAIRIKKKERRLSRLAGKEFEDGASDLQLKDRMFVEDEGGVQTPVRVILKVENGIRLTIMNQCHIHLTFQACQRNFMLNLGAKVDYNGELVYSNTVQRKFATHAISPPDMFKVMTNTSKSLVKLLGPPKPRPSMVRASRGKSKRKPCKVPPKERDPLIHDQEDDCYIIKYPEKKFLQCDLAKGETVPRLPLLT